MRAAASIPERTRPAPPTGGAAPAQPRRYDPLMSMPVRNLPVVQNWDCQGCGNCCRELQVHLSEEERARIEALGWDEVKELRGQRLFVRDGWWWARRTRLNHRPDGSCVFL